VATELIGHEFGKGDGNAYDYLARRDVSEYRKIDAALSLAGFSQSAADPPSKPPRRGWLPPHA
jgi:hypothetical protein